MTDPKHLFDYTLWPILKIFWEPFSRKNSHFWHWKTIKFLPNNYVTIQGNANAGKRHESIVKNLTQTNFLWKQAVVLKPEKYKGKYQIGFVCTEGKKEFKQLCSVILEESNAVLIGPYTTLFFALSYPDHRELKLEIIKKQNKWELDKNIFLV